MLHRFGQVASTELESGGSRIGEALALKVASVQESSFRQAPSKEPPLRKKIVKLAIAVSMLAGSDRAASANRTA
jgi:hypothetical protein